MPPVVRNFASISAKSYDLVVIGGGINGAATARDAALRGLKTVLIEKGDFGSATTSWSSRLVHGGLRYLEHFEFKLVRESLSEREILLKSAPHLVRPLQMTIPIYAEASRSYWEIWAGMMLYDLLSFDKSLLNHRMLPAAKLKQLFRSINSTGVTGAAQYFDAQVEYAERLCLETVLSAQSAGADVLNYVKVTGLARQGNRIVAVACVDKLSGERFTLDVGDNTMIVNTSGPWVDEVCDQAIENEQSAPIAMASGKSRRIEGTRGSHIVVDAFPGAPKTALYVEALSDNRPFFILPFLGKCLIGTTDIRFEGDLDRVKASDDEIDYLIAETNKVFPSAMLNRASVKFTYCGVRPLPSHDGKQPGAVTRNHILYTHSREGVVNMVSLVGGKLTTHRRVGEELVDWVCKARQSDDSTDGSPTLLPCQTRVQPLPGAILPTDTRMVEAANKYSDILPVTTLEHLFQLYGARTFRLLSLIDEIPELAEPIVDSLPDIKAQVVYAVRSEMAHTMADICRRRTMLALQADYGFGVLGEITQILQAHCGWSQEDCEVDLANYIQIVAENCIPDYALTRYGLGSYVNNPEAADETTPQLAVG